MKSKIPLLIRYILLSLLFSGCLNNNDRNSSRTVRIDTQEWMTGNLNVGSFRNGDPIPEARSDDEWQKAGQEGKPAWCYYENKAENGSRFGRLYNWYAITDQRGIAPAGWHISSDAEWRNTTDFLGGEDAAGTKMKSSNGWLDDGNGTNESGFTGLPGGCRDLNGRFGYIGKTGYWWSSTEYDSTLAWYRCIDRSPYYVYRTNYYKQNGLSVRCIRD